MGRHEIMDDRGQEIMHYIQNGHRRLIEIGNPIVIMFIVNPIVIMFKGDT